VILKSNHLSSLPSLLNLLVMEEGGKVTSSKISSVLFSLRRERPPHKNPKENIKKLRERHSGSYISLCRGRKGGKRDESRVCQGEFNCDSQSASAKREKGKKKEASAVFPLASSAAR